MQILPYDRKCFRIPEICIWCKTVAKTYSVNPTLTRYLLKCSTYILKPPLNVLLGFLEECSTLLNYSLELPLVLRLWKVNKSCWGPCTFVLQGKWPWYLPSTLKSMQVVTSIMSGEKNLSQQVITHCMNKPNGTLMTSSETPWCERDYEHNQSRSFADTIVADNCQESQIH